MGRRIFISSVMRDFGPVRLAAKEAVTRLRQHPVMAEDFGAQPVSSQTACLEGVRSSEIYVGIFGSRYGYKAPSSGLAATEEEFNEARRRGLPILCFEQKGSKEADQAAFLERIKGYETGYAFAFFDTPDELKMLVVQAIHDQIGQAGISVLDAPAAATVFDRCQWGSRRSDQGAAWLGAVMLPARQGEAFLDVLELGQKRLQNRLLQPALFGSESLLSVQLGVTTAEEGNALIFRQQKDRRLAASLEIRPDGSLVFGTALGVGSNDISLLGRMHVIDEEEVEPLLAAFVAYAANLYQGFERGDLITSVFFGTSLTGIEFKCFGKLPPGPINSFSIPQHGLPNPLRIPEAPLRVARAELSDAPRVARKMTEHMARIFRNAKAYYPSVSDRRRGSF